MSQVRTPELVDETPAGGWTAEQTIQGLAGRDARRNGEEHTHAHGIYWTAGYILGGLGINPITNARVRVTQRSWEKH